MKIIVIMITLMLFLLTIGITTEYVKIRIKRSKWKIFEENNKKRGGYK